MKLIQWTDELSTGIKKIDDEHKKFLGLLNTSNRLVRAKKYKALNKQLPDLFSYAKTHFSTEEDLFEKYNYPFSNEHKNEHLQLLEKTITFYDDAKNGKNVGEDLMDFLKDWFQNHLKKHDFKYTKYFQKNKIKVE
ncbi:MAG: bacteriohemerythrin [archaeon]|jgi:hemerythrin-like metal-binding protein